MKVTSFALLIPVAATATLKGDEPYSHLRKNNKMQVYKNKDAAIILELEEKEKTKHRRLKECSKPALSLSVPHLATAISTVQLASTVTQPVIQYTLQRIHRIVEASATTGVPRTAVAM